MLFNEHFEELYQHIESPQPVLCANIPISVRKVSPRGFTASPANSQSVGERLTREPRSGGFQPGPVHHTTQPSVGSQPSLLARGIRKEVSDFSLQQMFLSTLELSCLLHPPFLPSSF